MRIDLHTHSTASDGTLSPADVVIEAARAGLDVVALTDHDSAAGWAEAELAAEAAGIRLVPGVEVSTLLGGRGVHVLAYLADVGYPPLAAELAAILAGRSGRLPQMVERLVAAGVDITADEVRAQAGGSPAIGRPHVADVLVAKGVVGDRAEAFATWLGPGGPGYVARYGTPTEVMVRLITDAGGVAVVAHPWGRGSRRVLDAAGLARLRDHGLAGIEVEHEDHGPEDRAALHALATELDLVPTGSSDFHGAGKVGHALGCNLTAPAAFERLLGLAAANATASGRPASGAAAR